MFKYLLLLAPMVVAAAMFSFPVCAAEYNNSPALDKCIDNIKENDRGSRWPAFFECQKQELSSQDKRLNLLYKKVKTAAGKLGNGSNELLVSGQKQWISYRDAWCAFEESHDSAPNPEISGLFCRIELTKMQADRLAEQLDEIKSHTPDEIQ